MKRNQLGQYDPILNLWKDGEDTQLSFHEIKRKMEDQGWYERKIIRYLEKMVELGLLKKVKDGIKGSRAYYGTTTKTHEYEAQSFFYRVRKATQNKGLITRRDDSFIIYGITKKKEMTPLEKEIFDQIHNQIRFAFSNLYALKKSIRARKAVGQPLDIDLLRDYILEKVADQFRWQIWNKVYDTDTNDIENVINFSKAREVNIPNSEKYVAVEKKWKTDNVPIYERSYSGILSSFEEACLAVLVMLEPDSMAEYGYDSYNYLKKIIEYLEVRQKTFTDSDLVIFSKQFLKRERYRKKASTEEHDIEQRILGLRRWPWLKLKLGTDVTEKLIKIVYYLWKKYKTPRKFTDDTSVTTTIHIVTDEEQKKELEEIIRESQKIEL